MNTCGLGCVPRVRSGSGQGTKLCRTHQMMCALDEPRSVAWLSPPAQGLNLKRFQMLPRTHAGDPDATDAAVCTMLLYQVKTTYSTCMLTSSRRVAVSSIIRQILGYSLASFLPRVRKRMISWLNSSRVSAPGVRSWYCLLVYNDWKYRR